MIGPFRPEPRDPSPSPSPARGEGGFDAGANPAALLPGGKGGARGRGELVRQGSTERPDARTPQAPSPLAGEGEGEGSRSSRQHGDRRIAHARAMRKAPTDAERRLWALVRGKRLEGFKFRRQQPLGPYIVDMACLEKRLIVEADGGQHHENAQDARRDAWLRAQGFRVLRFWNREILREPRMVEDTILRELGAAPFRPEPRDPSPSPSPARGEGGFDAGVSPAAPLPGGKGDGARQGSLQGKEANAEPAASWEVKR